MHNGRLPPLTDVGKNAPTGAGLHSLFHEILPFIGEERLFRLPEGSGHAIKTYLNPADLSAASDASVPMTITLSWEPPAPFQKSFTRNYSTTSFAANALIFGSNDAWLKRTFKDGPANTIIIAERYQFCSGVYNFWGYGVWGPTMPAFAALTPSDPAGLRSTGMISPATPLPATWTSATVPVKIGIASAAAVAPSPPAPGTPYRVFQAAPRGAIPCDPRVPQTPFASGVLVALADGSVRSIAPTISEWTFWAACTPDGGETLYTDW
jgi:hypothetical protein